MTYFQETADHKQHDRTTKHNLNSLPFISVVSMCTKALICEGMFLLTGQFSQFAGKYLFLVFSLLLLIFVPSYSVIAENRITISTTTDATNHFDVIQTELSKINKKIIESSESTSVSVPSEVNLKIRSQVIAKDNMDVRQDKLQTKGMAQKKMMMKEKHPMPMKSSMGMMTMMGKKPAAISSQDKAILELPGDSNAPHLYHLGETSFFLDHAELVSLNQQQTKQLENIKQTWFSHSKEATKDIDALEEQLWELTSEGKPDAKKIEDKIRQITVLQANLRIDFIRKVGEAVSVLSPDQIRVLIVSSTVDG